MGIYLNNAATSFPKPEVVLWATVKQLTQPPEEPGRGSRAADPLAACRQELATLFHVADSRQVILAPSATHALNTVLFGLLQRPRDGHAVTTMLEHNSVLRPLAHLQQLSRLRLTILEPVADRIEPEAVAQALRPDTRLVAVTHASNVTGSIQPVAEIAEVAARANVPLLIDAAQSAGAVPLDYARLPGRVFVAFAGHKGLFGPAGTGGLIVPDDRLPQGMVGGTGVHSESHSHPGFLPLRHEAGTPNLSGLAGLGAGAAFVNSRGVEACGHYRHTLVQFLREALSKIAGVWLAPLAGDDGRAGIVSFTLADRAPAEVGFALHESFDIDVRSGLHCAPLAHRALGTAPAGTVRVSVAAFTHYDDVAQFIQCLQTLVVSCAK